MARRRSCVVAGCKGKASDRGAGWYSCDRHYAGRGIEDIFRVVAKRIRKGQQWSVTITLGR